MQSDAPQARDERELVRITDDFEEPGEVTGVREKIRSTVDLSDYPSRPDRIQSFEKIPTKDLEQSIRTQLYVWERDIMMKTQIVIDDDPERKAIIENVLKEYERADNNKVYSFTYPFENEKQAYTVYYDHKGKKNERKK